MIGFAVGVGVCAAGYYVYKQNESKVDAFLRTQGINVPNHSGKSFKDMNLEELMMQKEQLEDLIAEKEMEDGEVVF